MSDSPPPVQIEAARTSFWDRASVVWLLPIAALVIALGIAAQYYLDRGPVIEIVFADASGVKARETELRYRDVAVGLVEKVGFTPDLENVLLEVRLDKNVAAFVDEDAQFWIIAPEVSTRGVTGLDTVLGGVFIEGNWDNDPGPPATRVIGLSDAPLLTPNGERGLSLELRSSLNAGFTDETPILFKGIEVGRIGSARIAINGSAAIANAVIYPPYDQIVTTETRFWDSSGFSVSIGPEGAEVDFDSLASLLSGGITFDTLVAGGQPVREGTVFEVYPEERDARASIFAAPVGTTHDIVVVFDENVGGLTPGARVELDRAAIGKVDEVTGLVDPVRFGDRLVRVQATLSLEPAKMGLGDDATREEMLEFLSLRAAEGVRARLASQGLLSGGVKVELVAIPGAGPAPIVMEDGIDAFPTGPAALTDVASTAEGVFERINALPIEEMLGSAIRLMNTVTALVEDPELNATPGELRGLLAEMRGLVGAEEVQALPGDVSALMGDLQAVASELRTVVAAITAEDGVARLLAAVDAAGVAAEQVGAATQGLPPLVAEFEALAAKANALPMEELITEATGLVGAANGIVGSEAAQAMPTQLNAALGELSAVLESVTSEDGVARLLAAVDAAGVAASQVGAATEGLPVLLAEVEALAAKANALPLEELITQATGLVGAANGIVASEAAQAVPVQLNAALAELSAVLETVTSEDGVTRLLAAVDAAGVAATQVGAATQGVPGLVAQIETLAAQATALPLADLVAQATGLLESANGLVASDAAQAMPEQLNAALGELSEVLEAVTSEDGVARLLAAVDAAGAAAAQVGAATDGVPALIAQIETVAASAAALPLEELVIEVSALVASADGVIGTDAARELPEALNTALGELSAVLASLQDGGLIENANGTLSAARRAADQIAISAESFPAAINRVDSLLRQAEATLAALDGQSDLNRGAVAALRDIQAAADAVTSLARTLERRPNSLIIGR